MFTRIILFKIALAAIGDPGGPLDKCSCYCCPSIRSPYGLDPSCNITNPEWIGAYPIGNPIMVSATNQCSAIGCFTNFGVNCPAPPLHGPKNESGVIKWGCDLGCRFASDGIRIINESTSDIGLMVGDEGPFSGSLNRSLLGILMIITIFLVLQQ